MVMPSGSGWSLRFASIRAAASAGVRFGAGRGCLLVSIVYSDKSVKRKVNDNSVIGTLFSCFHANIQT